MVNPQNQESILRNKQGLTHPNHSNPTSRRLAGPSLKFCHKYIKTVFFLVGVMDCTALPHRQANTFLAGANEAEHQQLSTPTKLQRS